MGIMIDLIIIAIILLSSLMGYKKGLVNALFNLLAFVVAIIITFFLYKPVTNWVIDNTDFDNRIENAIIENGIIDEDIDYFTDATNSLADKVVEIFVTIGLFIITRLVLCVARGIAKGIATLPLIKQFNEVGGLLYGILRGAFFVYLMLAIAFLVISINDTGIISNAINTSFIAKMLYENNIILNIIL